ncbi:MAG: hypothetical protein WKF40_00910 [Thermoleophilaceae bacterium]
MWGRELAHLRLDTTGGPSWKPLPVAFTTLFAPFGALDDSLPPALWLVVARAGALLALALAFRLARRLVGAGPGGVAAGVVAAVALALTPQWLRYAAHGNEAPLAAALMLWALHSHLDGSRRGALVLGFAACLMRPEVFPFVALYGAWCWRAEPDMRRMTVGLAAALAALWLVPEWIGSGQPLGAGAQARSEPSWSLVAARAPVAGGARSRARRGRTAAGGRPPGRDRPGRAPARPARAGTGRRRGRGPGAVRRDDPGRLLGQLALPVAGDRGRLRAHRRRRGAPGGAHPAPGGSGRDRCRCWPRYRCPSYWTGSAGSSGKRGRPGKPRSSTPIWVSRSAGRAAATPW